MPCTFLQYIQKSILYPFSPPLSGYRLWNWKGSFIRKGEVKNNASIDINAFPFEGSKDSFRLYKINNTRHRGTVGSRGRALPFSLVGGGVVVCVSHKDGPRKRKKIYIYIYIDKRTVCAPPTLFLKSCSCHHRRSRSSTKYPSSRVNFLQSFYFYPYLFFVSLSSLLLLPSPP